MLQRTLLCLVLLFGGAFCAYIIPNVKVQVNGKQISASIPAEQGIKSVFFALEINGKWPADFDYLQAPSEGLWLINLNTLKELKPSDKLRVSVVVDHEEKVFQKYIDFTIDKHSQAQIDFKSAVINVQDEDWHKKCAEYMENIRKNHCLKAETQFDDALGKCSGTLIFEDNFDSNSIDLKKWTHEVRNRVGGEDPELVAYMKNETNSFIEKGNLYLKATWNSDSIFNVRDICTSKEKEKTNRYTNECGVIIKTMRSSSRIPPLYSAKLHTKNSFNFKYGRVEIRAKMPVGDWLFPYLFLQSSSTFSESNWASHIRIAFARGNKDLQDKAFNQICGQTLYGGAIVYAGALSMICGTNNAKPATHYGEDFHNYTVIWHEDSILFKVDNLTYCTITNKDVLKEFNKNKVFIVLGLTAGGDLNFNDQNILAGQKKFKNGSPKSAMRFKELYSTNYTISANWLQPTLEIDYVRVYATDPFEI